ncbi:hypothetical protein SCLCIDRAFT_1225058 [Scleroderma citrinum Foug A]|uniref:Uncharacterized protein n=1 Tax=Scleroderma citrinum Foug A TaxID=1036808 RepID=A0A0C2YM80_9AGAM|nr:hypothetical protein SCLCIDRAFT_1225058 [Scleroderma citrinum Foug A]
MCGYGYGSMTWKPIPYPRIPIPVTHTDYQYPCSCLNEGHEEGSTSGPMAAVLEVVTLVNTLRYKTSPILPVGCNTGYQTQN